MAGGSVWAQQITDSRTSTIRGGGGGEGKCTVEVEVDGIAEVEVEGNRAQIRTLSGSPSRFRRFECNQEMPRNPAGFRFQGVDGRGRQDVERDGGRGPIVIRIEDAKGGREGYTFDLFWNGGGGGGGWNDSNRGDNRGAFGNNNNGGGWNRELRFDARGRGSFQNDRGSTQQLRNCRVDIGRDGNVQVSFQTNRSQSVNLNGRVVRIEGDRIYADMNGSNIGGMMLIETDGRDQVRSVSMRQPRNHGGRNGYDLNWRGN